MNAATGTDNDETQVMPVKQRNHTNKLFQEADTVIPPDGGWGWVCLVAGMIPSFLQGGLVRSFSMLFENLRERHDSSASATAWVYSINSACQFASGPVTAALVQRFNCHLVALCGALMVTVGMTLTAFAPSLYAVYVTYGVFAGVGKGFEMTTNLLVISYWFRKRRARATSLYITASAVGAIAVAPVVEALLKYYGYTGTWMILGAIFLHIAITGVVWRRPNASDVPKHRNIPDVVEYATHTNSVNFETDYKQIPEQDNINNTKDKQATTVKVEEESIPVPLTGFRRFIDYQLFCNVRYAAFAVTMMFGSMCFSISNTHQAGLSYEHGLSQSQLALLLSTMGAVGMGCIFGSGFLFDAFKGIRIDIWCYAGGFYLWWLIYMVCFSVVNSQESIVLADIVTSHEFPRALGLSRFCRLFGCVIGPTFGGYLKDLTGTYNLTFHFSGSVFLVMVTNFYIVLLCQRKTRQSSKVIQVI